MIDGSDISRQRMPRLLCLHPEMPTFAGLSLHSAVLCVVSQEGGEE